MLLLGPDGDLNVAQKAQAAGTGRFVGEEARLRGRVGIMAARASKVLLGPRGVSLALNRMVLLESITGEDVFSVFLIGMACLAQVGHRLEKQLGAVRCVGIMATQAVARSYRRMDRLLVELFLVVTLKAEVWYGGG